MTTTVLALFKDRGDAEAAIRALKSAQFDSARLGIVHRGDAHVPPFGRNAVLGVAGGALGCGLIGVVVGIIASGLIPGIPAWLPGGWFVPLMLGLAGAGTGTVAGLLMSQSASERGAYYYEDEVAAGRTLVTVHAPPDRADQARRILLDLGAFDASPIDAPIQKAS